MRSTTFTLMLLLQVLGFLLIFVGSFLVGVAWLCISCLCCFPSTHCLSPDMPHLTDLCLGFLGAHWWLATALLAPTTRRPATSLLKEALDSGGKLVRAMLEPFLYFSKTLTEHRDKNPTGSRKQSIWRRAPLRSRRSLHLCKSTSEPVPPPSFSLEQAAREGLWFVSLSSAVT